MPEYRFYYVCACMNRLNNWVFLHLSVSHDICSLSVSHDICSLSVSQFSEKFWNQYIYWVKQLLYAQLHGNLIEIMNAYLIETKPVHSSAFPALSIWHRLDVHHFDTVNHLDTVETGHMRIPSMCSCPPASSFPGLRKAGQGPGNNATHSLDLTSFVDS